MHHSIAIGVEVLALAENVRADHCQGVPGHPELAHCSLDSATDDTCGGLLPAEQFAEDNGCTVEAMVLLQKVRNVEANDQVELCRDGVQFLIGAPTVGDGVLEPVKESLGGCPFNWLALRTLLEIRKLVGEVDVEVDERIAEPHSRGQHLCAQIAVLDAFDRVELSLRARWRR